MNYIKKMARGCCCTCKHDVRDTIIDLVAQKLNEIVVDGPVTLEQAAELINDKLDELLSDNIPEENIATDEDI